MEIQLADSLLINVKIDTPQTYQNLTIFPLVGENGGVPPYLLIEEALRTGSMEIKEIEQGVVPEVWVVNKEDRDILFLSGEELLGGKQNRTVNVSLLVPARSSYQVPVSCTERGRWKEGQWGSKMGETPDYYSSSPLRRALITSVTESLKFRGTYYSDQANIWDTLSHSFSSMEVTSRTQAQKDLFDGKKRDLEDYLAFFSSVPHQRGIIGMVNGEVKGLDLFGFRDTMEKMFQKLLKSFIIEAISSHNESPAKKMKEVEIFLDDLHNSKVRKVPAPGKGEHLIFEGKEQRGMALVVDGKLLHLYSAPI